MSKHPKGWDYLNLDSVCISSQYGINAPSIGGKYPVLGMRNLQDGNIYANEVGYVDLPDDEFKRFRLNPGDLLINRTNSIDLVGKTALFNLEGDFLFASYLVRFILNTQKVSPAYINYFCNSHEGNTQMRRLATKGVSQANINPTELKKNFRIPLPPLPEQHKIAEILYSWDESIAKVECLLASLRQRKNGLMQRLLTGKVRFPEFTKKWHETKLGNVLNERVEQGFEHLPLLSVTENGITYREQSNRRDTSSEDKSKYLRICPGDIGYNTMRMWQGRSALSKYEGIVSPAYTVLTPTKSIDVRFMVYLFKYQPMIHTFYRYSQGLVSDTWSLKYPVFAKIHVKIPEYQEQKRIADVLESCDKEINETQAYYENLQEQKKGLLQKLLTGQIRVKV